MNQISTIYAFRHLWSTLSHSTHGENYIKQGLVNLNIIMTWTRTGLHATPEPDISITLLPTRNTETIRDTGRALGGGGGGLKTTNHHWNTYGKLVRQLSPFLTNIQRNARHETTTKLTLMYPDDETRTRQLSFKPWGLTGEMGNKYDP